MRMQYNLGSGVYAFPSSGGMLQKDCSTVELLYLGMPTKLPVEIDKFEDDVGEDRFCHKMRLLGATPWPSMGHWIETLIGDRQRVGDENVEVRIGWPTDGNGASDMDELCRMIEEMGGRFYERAEECPELRKAFEDDGKKEVVWREFNYSPWVPIKKTVYLSKSIDFADDEYRALPLGRGEDLYWEPSNLGESCKHRIRQKV
ncbi:hypothetical protein VTL71DRAFT_9102 [Oculimacula yallundae]|uniref:Uncharacterized protein n=1 Tax=Oculimacula yallundae TaxID=86028 RepID=A0ABR4BTW9_9HELO